MKLVSVALIVLDLSLAVLRLEQETPELHQDEEGRQQGQPYRAAASDTRSKRALSFMVERSIGAELVACSRPEPEFLAKNLAFVVWLLFTHHNLRFISNNSY